MTIRRKTPLLLLTMLGAALAFLLVPTSGMAVHNAGCPLSGSPPIASNAGCLFELDGNVQNDTASGGNNGGFDWASGPGGPGVFDSTGTQTLVNPQLLKADFVADYTQPDTSYFATSTKDIDDVSTWQCGSVNNPTPKDEITNAYAALWSPGSGADAGHVILTAASERLSNNGNAFMGFWLFQGRVGCNSPTGAATPFFGAHNFGDVLVLSNFTGGGANPLVQVYVWNPGTPQATNPLELKFTGNFCSASSNDPTIDQACGAVNPTSFQTPWLPSNTALTDVDPNEFLEVGVDLTQLLGNANATIPCFARFQAETRTSQQTTAQLKDFASGSFNTCTATTVTHPKDANGTTLSDSTPVPSSTVIHDEATVTGTALVGSAPNPKGTVAFSYCRPTDQTAGGSTACDASGSTSAGTATLTGASNPATVSSNTVSGLSAGRYCFTATYVDTGTPPDYPLPASDSSTTECFAIGNPHLTITKTADQPSTVSAGGTIGFTVNLANDGQSTATGVEINDNLPGGTGTPTPTPVHWSIASQSGASPACTLTGADGSQVLHCGPQSLAVGSSISVHLTATTSFAACGQYDNTATFTSTNAGTGQASASATCLKPDLHLTKTPDHAAPVNAGDQIGFTVTLSNSGPGTATGVEINDPLPPGTVGTVTWSLASSNDPSCAVTGAVGSQTLHCGPESLASGGSITAHVVATTSFANCGVYNNTATFTTTNDGTNQASAQEACLRSNLTLTKTPDHAAPVNAGDQIGFTVTLSNSGPGTATGVEINDPLPPGTVGTVTWSLASSNDPSCAVTGAVGSQTLHCGPESLASGGSITAHVVATTSFANCGVYNNTATFTTTNDGTNQASAQEACLRSNLTLTKTPDHAAPVNAGDQIGFTVTLSNSGPGTATGVEINDPLPPGTVGTVTWSLASSNDPSCAVTGAVGSQTLHCGPESLASGGSITAHVVATTSFANCGVYNNTATFTTTNDGTNQASAQEACLRSNLTLTKTPDHAAPVNAGDQIGFTVTLSNSGPGTATGVEINDPLPPGTVGTVTWSLASSNDPSCAVTGAVGSQTLHCGPESLASGGSITAHVVATTSFANCGVYNNTATFTTTNDGTNQASAQEACLRSNLTLTKTPDHAAPVNAGDQIGFTVTLSNSGPGTATGVEINDPLPPGTVGTVTWSLASSNDPSCAVTGAVGSQTLHCGPESLASGGSITAHVVATTSFANCGVYNNTATFTTTNDGTNQASAQEACLRSNLTLTKTPDHAAPVNAGDQIGFTVTLSNSGPGTATGVEINDPLPPGTVGTVTWSLASSNDPSCAVTGAVGSQTLHCGPESLASGGSITAHVVATTSFANCGVYNNTATFTTTNDGTNQASAQEACLRSNLTLTKTPDHAAPVNAGDQIGFTVTLSNSGPGTATGVEINDPLPPGTVGTVTWSLASSNDPSCAVTGAVGSQTLHCGPESLASGGSITAHVVATTSFANCGVYNNTATFTTTNDGTNQASAQEACLRSNLTLTKTPDHAAPVNAGDQIGFTVTLSNSGPGTATGVEINDPLPPGTVGTVTWSLASSNDPSCAVTGAVGSQTLHCGPESLASGGSITAHVVATTSFANCGVYNNTATFTTTNDGTNQASAQEACLRSNLTLTKTPDHAAPVNAGDQIGFTVTLSNSGPGTATGVEINDPLPPGTVGTVTWSLASSNDPSCAVTGAVGSQTLHCGPESLASGGSITAHVVATTSFANCGVYNNTATFTTTNDGTNQASAQEACLRSNLTLTKTPDHAAPVNAGDQIGFTVTLSNSGPGTATGVEINDPLPPGTVGTVTWSLASSNDPSCAVTGAVGSQTLHCGPESLASGGSITAHVVATTSFANCGVYNNTATFTTTNDGTNQASAQEACLRASIHITKTADASPVNAGTNIGFTLTVSNSGPGTAHGVVLTDTLPTNAGLSWTVDGGTAAATCSISSGVLTCNIGDLASGASATVHISSPTTTATCGTVNNTGNVTTSNDGSDSASASITVICPRTSQITETGTTCQQFKDGTAVTLGQVQYSLRNGAISQVNPGVFFYWNTVTASGQSTFTITQTINPSFDSHYFTIASGSFVYDANCNKVTGATVSPGANGSVIVSFDAGSGTHTFFYGIKYSTGSVVGAATTPITYTYTFATQNVAGSTESILLTPK